MGPKDHINHKDPTLRSKTQDERDSTNHALSMLFMCATVKPNCMHHVEGLLYRHIESHVHLYMYLLPMIVIVAHVVVWAPERE